MSYSDKTERGFISFNTYTWHFKNHGWWLPLVIVDKWCNEKGI
jgi:hypothetical protein